MPERASIFQTVQIGVEVTPGTGVAANKKLPSLDLSTGIKIETKRYRPMGKKFPTVVVPGKEWTEAGLSGPLTYNELVYLLSSVLGYAAPVQQGATTAYLWTHAPDSDGPDTVKTFTVEQGSSVRAHKFAYGFVNELELSFDRDKCELGGKIIGQALQDGITMTASPTEIALKPVLPTHIDVYLADTQAGLAGASPLERVVSVSWKISNRFSPFYPLATASGTGFATTVEAEPELMCTLLMEADAAGMALLTNARAGSSKFLRIKAVGDLIASTYYYTLQIDAALKVDSVDEYSDEDGVYAIGWNFVAADDVTWGKATEVQVTNVLTAL
jgi:hypothetical protein